MPVDVCGFLEISIFDKEDLGKEYVWMSCLNIGSLSLDTGNQCDVLFGESKSTVSEPDTSARWLPIAQRRGVPHNMGNQTAEAVAEALRNDNSIMSTWGFTHIYYDEIAQIKWESYSNADFFSSETSGWGLLFKLMKTLDEASRYQRLVVWFEWR